MRILYKNRGLEELCTDDRKAKKELGLPGFRKLRDRLADLEAASVVGELVAGRPHPLVGDLKGHFAVSLDGGRRLVFEPAFDPPPRRANDDGIDWDHVDSVRIVAIEDYHD